MNLLLLEKEELLGDEAVVCDRRAEHLLNILQVEPGSVVRLGLIGGNVGSGTVLAIEKKTVRLQVSLKQEPVRPPHIELILALPRPIMLKRVLKQGTVLGVRHFHLIRSRRVEKSFFASPALQPDKVRASLLEGMEQAMDTWLPEVHIHRQFKPFIEDVLPTLKGQGLIAHPTVTSCLLTAYSALAQKGPLLLSIGPEGGWSDFEVDAFIQKGFKPFSMGSRILHVDTAVVALMAQLDLLYTLRENR